MANFNDAIKSFINGLSDFWLLYFKEKDQLDALYKGAEVLVGQSYLDMMSLLLNNSVQDTTIFNKEFFKLITLKESDIAYVAGANKRDDRYAHTLTDGTSGIRYLHNKVLSPTASWDEGKDFDLVLGADDNAESFLKFKYDPTNAYRQLLVGAPESRIYLRAREIESESWTVSFYDDTILPYPVAQVFQDTYTVIFDGAGNNSRDSTDSLIQAMRDSAQFSASFITELESGSGKISPYIACDYQLLAYQDTAPLDNYAVREVSTSFDCKLVGPTSSVYTELIGPSFWPAHDIHKGDIVRLLRGATLGRPQELSIKLHRKIDLYLDLLNPEEDFRFESGDAFDFVVLRDLEDPHSLNEPFEHSGIITATGSDGSIDENTKTFTITTPSFHPAHVGDILHLTGQRNYGSPTIISYVNEYTVVVGLANALTEPINDPSAGLIFLDTIDWQLRSVHSNTYLETLVFAGIGDILMDGRQLIGATFSTAPDVSTIGKVLYMHVDGLPVKSTIIGISGNIAYGEYPTEVTTVFGSPAAIATELTPSTEFMFQPDDNFYNSYPKENTTVVKARRYVDNKVVEEGIDYEVNVDTFTVTPLTVWQTSVINTFDYEFRRCMGRSSLLGGGLGSFVTGGTFTPATASTSASFTWTGGASDLGNPVGSFLSLGGAAVPINEQLYVITAYSHPVIELESAPAFTTPDANNGVLTGLIVPAWSISTTDVIADEIEIAMWSPDAQLDKFHLYNTYGYLINRFERSSEDYRALVRGLFQLFMLGPTLERFESAINTVAGLGTIRDDGEILLKYEDGADQLGTDGALDFNTSSFYSPTAAFTADSSGEYIYVTTGANANTLFHIQRMIDANTVEVFPRPVTSAGVSWEVTRTALQRITTSRTAYEFDRQIPIKDTVKDPSSIGTTIFRAFETLTEVFRVTDYIETPAWWESVQIPENLLPGELPARRQSTPNLFENVINPGDEGRIGDPGFIIGADSEGFTPPQVLLRDDAGAADGELIGDLLFPNSNDVRFTSATAAFTALDLNNLVAVPAGGTTYRITEVVSTTEVKLEAFTEVASLSTQSWEIVANPLAKRHKAAFVILNEILKYQMFEVEFDAALLGILPANVLTDLEELVFVAKPTYTYLVLTPSTLFDEIITVGEDLITRPALLLGGSLGNWFNPNSNQLKIGDSWTIGNWFRYEENTSTFAAPIVTLTDALGAPAAGYTKHVNKILIDQNDFTSNDTGVTAPVPVTWLDALGIVGFGAASDITVTGTDAVIDLGVVAEEWWVLSCVAYVTGSGAGNDGLYSIGKATGNTVTVPASGLVDEVGVGVAIYAFGTREGRTYMTDTGLSMFSESDANSFAGSHVGSAIYRYYDSYSTNQFLRMGRFVDTNNMELFKVKRIAPAETEADFTCDVTGTTTLTDLSGALFSSEMGRIERLADNYATSDSKRYYVEFTSGANNGTRVLIQSITSTSVIELNTPITNDTGASYFIEIEEGYTLVDETTVWWAARDVFTTERADVEFWGGISQNVNAAVDYTAYGVREPDDPSLETFDETSGDTLYSIGMVDPKPPQGRSRSGWHVDLREEPIQITRTPFP